MNIFEELANEFIQTTCGAHGRLARPNDTHYSAALVTQAIQGLRSQLGRGETLNEEGHRFVAGAAAYLGYLTFLGFERRGLDTSMSAAWEADSDESHLVLFAARDRDGEQQSYGHDFLRDMHQAILCPPQSFPCMKGRNYVLTSLSLPGVESLYLTGVHFMLSPYSAGNWPEGDHMLGDDDDFALARELLIDDLHTDIEVPVDDPELRQLANWVVWPPYGWDMNDGQSYNMMTLMDQIFFQKALPFDKAIDYLRHLLFSQAFHLRNLAARTLMVLGVPPQEPQETRFYTEAMHASDQSQGNAAMVSSQWLVDGNPKDREPDAEFAGQALERWQGILNQGPRDPWFDAPVFSDPLYEQYGTTDTALVVERHELARQLVQRYPDDWFARVAHGHALLVGPSPEQGEAILVQAMADSPGDPTAHFSLGGYYCERDAMVEAKAVYEDVVGLCPWNHHAVGNAMWALTREMAEPSSELQI